MRWTLVIVFVLVLIVPEAMAVAARCLPPSGKVESIPFTNKAGTLFGAEASIKQQLRGQATALIQDRQKALRGGDGCFDEAVSITENRTIFNPSATLNILVTGQPKDCGCGTGQTPPMLCMEHKGEAVTVSKCDERLAGTIQRVIDTGDVTPLRSLARRAAPSLNTQVRQAEQQAPAQPIVSTTGQVDAGALASMFRKAGVAESDVGKLVKAGQDAPELLKRFLDGEPEVLTQLAERADVVLNPGLSKNVVTIATQQKDAGKMTNGAEQNDTRQDTTFYPRAGASTPAGQAGTMLGALRNILSGGLSGPLNMLRDLISKLSGSRSDRDSGSGSAGSGSGGSTSHSGGENIVPPPVSPVHTLVVQQSSVRRGEPIHISWASVGMSASKLCKVIFSDSSGEELFVAERNEGSGRIETSSDMALGIATVALECTSATTGNTMRRTIPVELL
ncbi:hypothetical protein COU20_03900 [Candidatus Kaiserbacteria bacterium CG10_big_fil_rev_8_21_14_0_10_59_10]|uniref:Uncharacterized protein n=1 Tax=Candidatus Kaiserbacteria bacterium CG10_big_fil_rev_8_21_14_0_10_59_10 TaxID=1974612 RepID=A0A2H0U768_9BACT|nr:MAG: hypothetical protein COU20_03900 [Candidatus Kaiserbacteria bacterium CG10_big_fil_rev_8_21_14_0_10_59_10]